MVNFGTVPLIGMAMAVTSVTGQRLAKETLKTRNGASLCRETWFFIGLVVMLAILVFAPFIAKAFTYSQEGERIYSELVRALRVLSLFLPGVPFGMFTSSMFQGVGQGLKSLAVTIMRTVIMQVLFSWLFVFVLKAGLMGVWWGIVLGNATSAFITFTWGRFTVNRLKKEFQAL